MSMGLAHQMFVGLVAACCSQLPCQAADNAPLMATYRLETTSKSEAAARSLQWQLRRAAGCVVVSDDQGRVTERWDRDAQGRIWYRRIFHVEKKVIEYQPADLRMAAVEAEWARIAGIIDPRELQQLTLQPTSSTFEGEVVATYRGMRAGVPWEIGWLATEGIPERIVVRGPGGDSTLRLITKEHSPAQAGVCDIPGLTDYDTIDFADIGDRHGDPFIERLMKYEGLMHGHR